MKSPCPREDNYFYTLPKNSQEDVKELVLAALPSPSEPGAQRSLHPFLKRPLPFKETVERQAIL